jgi:hypothetical protein
MEYTCKNEPSGEAYHVVLNHYHMVIRSTQTTETIPYANITGVRLSKKKNLYKTTITSVNHLPIVLSNRFFFTDGKYEDLSKQYNAFVRILHYHLRDKSHALFSSGRSINNLLILSVVAAFASFFFSFISEYIGMSLLNPFLQSILLSMGFILIIVFININQFPRKYKPDQIPNVFLPDYWK